MLFFSLLVHCQGRAIQRFFKINILLIIAQNDTGLFDLI